MNDTIKARQLLESGRFAEAERAYQEVLEKAPDNAEALNVIALAALRTGKAQRAVDLLGRAATANPQDPVTQHHLGRAYEALGDLPRAAMAHAEAVRLEPAFFIARLYLGVCLEQLRVHEEALVQYKRALDDAQGQGRWLNPATTPTPLQPMVSHAVVAVRQGRHALFETLIAPLRARYGSESMSRVEWCVRIYLNEEPAVYPDPRQRPKFLLFPGLPTSAYIDLAQFDWIEALQAATPAIREELDRLLPSPTGRERVFESEALEAQNMRGLEAAPSWNGYYFFRHGERRDDNCRSCPATTGALESLPLARIREHGPEVLFSVFTAGTLLMPHRGVTNTRVVGHLPLIVPEDCALSVGGEIHEWRTGKIVVFDDTYEHEAWNRSRNTRVVLIFDVWNPYLSDAERAAVTDLVAAIGDFRRAVEEA
ncbi:MAG: aspartyl beta-hydroxylase [Gammaproteobacteria bacterium]|nr:aspartyl beta-hydroxylase [Gammaproteobacteria bacterium]